MNRHARLIVNADDFGLHTSINDGIRLAHAHGIVTSCSLIASPDTDPHLSAAFDHAIGIARELPRLDVGLHFALAGVPGLPRGYKGFAVAYAAGRFPACRIELLLNRQIDTLEQSDIHPSHIDSHQHIHALPGIMRIVCNVAKQRGIGAVRVPIEYRLGRVPVARAAASRILGLFAAASGRIANRSGLWSADRFLGMAVSGHLTESALHRLIDQIAPRAVTELICHPASSNASLAATYGWGYNWEGELRALTDESAMSKLTDCGVALSTFKAQFV